MKFSDLMDMAFSGLWRRKIRTALTVLAVVIGATLVALVIALGSGLQSFVVGQFGLSFPETAIIASSNSDLDVFSRGDSGPHEISTSETEVIEPFTTEDMEVLRTISGVERVDYLASVSARYVQPESSDRIYTVSVNGVPDYEAAIRPLFSGSYFNDSDSGVCLLAYDYIEAFGWDDNSAVGRTINVSVGKLNAYDIRIQEYTFMVVGVIDKSLSSAEILVPLKDAIEMARFYQDNPLRYSEPQPGFVLQLKATDVSNVDSIAAAVEAMGFGATAPEDILDQINSVFGVIQTGLAAFGVIALVVASIGIINTLLMAIHERTREIGVMKAVGATRNNIRLLFTTEGAALGFLGGAIGGGLALLFGKILNFVGSRTFLSDFPGFELTHFQFWLVPSVIALTTLVSLLAGLYPANRAASLDPVQALSYE